MPGFPVLHYFPELAQTHVHWANDAIQLSNPLWPPFFPTFNLSQHHGLFQWVISWHQVAKVLELFSASVLLMNIQSWLPLGLISLQSKRLSRVFSNTIVWKHQFFGALPSLWSSSYMHTWLLENHSFDYMDRCQPNDVSAFEYAVQVCHSFLSKEQTSFNFMAAVTVHSEFGAKEPL